MTPLTITPEQRDALYEQILDRLSGIGDVWLAVCSENFDAAERLGREYSDDLRLVLDDLGFGDGSGEMIELTTPPDVLQRVLSRLHDLAVEQDRAEADERAEAEDYRTRNRLVRDTCRRVLVGIGG
jgi:hypothetical protein